jgi:two-component system chemotaxis response regulator CheY
MAGSEAKILIVDDEAHMRRMVRRMLHQIGFLNVDENDGTTVLQTLKNYRYDLVICDWQMTPTPGIEVLEFVRADADLKALPFIMLTGENTSTGVLAAVNAGTHDYITKPFSLQTLRAKVERVLALREQ